MKNSLSVFISLALVVFAAMWSFGETADCTTPNDKPGTCIPLNDCALYTRLLQRYEEHVPGFFRDYLRQSVCSGSANDSNPYSCCPNPK